MKRKELLKQSKKLAAVVATAALLDSGALAVHAAENVNAEAVQSQTGASDFTQSESETEQVAEPDDNHMEEQQSEGDVAQSEELTETVLTEEQPTETEQVSDQIQQDQTPDQVQGDAAPETDEDTTSETEKQDEAEGILEEDDTEQTESEDTDVSEEKTEDVTDQSQSDNEQNNSTESDEEKSLENAQLVAADGQKGWVEDENGDSSYFEEDGKKVTGLYYIDDKRYYFDNNGILQKNAGTVLIDDEGTGDLHLYCIDENGAVATGWVENSEYGLCYFREDGRAIDSGVQTIDGKKYLFFLYGMRADADCIFSREDENGQIQVYRTDADGVLITGWYQQDDDTKFYYDSEGREAHGIVTIDNKQYYFSDAGVMYTDYSVLQDGKFYYFDNEGIGKVQKNIEKDGWVQVNNAWYYVKSGELVYDQILTLGKNRYYIASDGQMYQDTYFSVYDQESETYYQYYADSNGVLKTGWYKTPGEDEWYYFESDGKGTNGVRIIDGTTYYFSDGLMKTDYVCFENGCCYYFGKDGKQKVAKTVEKDGWVQVNDSWYYVKSGELVRDEILNLGKKSYYIRYDGKMCQNAFFWAYDEDSDKDYRYYADANGVLVSGWRKVQGDEEEEGGWYYFESDGKGAEGVKTINGATYFFNNGLMRTNYICFENGCLYHFDEDGKQDTAKTVEKDGWVQFDNSWYYVRSGALVRNEILHLGKKSYYIGYDGKMWKDSFCFVYDEDTDTDSIYYVDENGYVVTGWYKMKEEDALYYFENNGKAADGIKNISGVTYYFIEGRMQTEYATVDNNNFYYFDEKGIAHSREIQGNGWIKCDENWFYIENQKVVRRTFLQLGKYKYYFDKNGKMYANSYLSIWDEDTEDYCFYRFEQSGHMITGWYEDACGDCYYFGSDGRGVTGFQNIGGKTYYFDQDTYVLVKDKAKVQEGYFYYIDSDGILQTKKAVNGDSWISCNNNWYYMKDGKLLSDSFLTVGKYTYYLDYNGVMVTDTAIGIWNDDEADEDYYRLDSYGHVVTGWFRDNWGDMYYYGTDGKSAQGVIVLNSKVYNFSSQGMLLPDSVAYYDGKVYYFGDDGIGTQIDKNGWIENSIYVENGKVVTGWKKLNGKWYYFSEDTARKLVDGDYEINGSSYYFDEAGIMKTGWIRTGYYDGYDHYVENYLYADANGKLKQDVWMKSGDKWYYFNGVYMAKGIVRIGDVYHSFEADGTWNRQLPSATNGWIKVASVWYYFENNQLITDETKVIGGKKYCFDDDGSMFVNVSVNNSYYGANGAALKNQWREVTPGKWEYYDSDYQRINSGWKVINGSKYYFVDNYAVCRDMVIDNVLYHFTTGGVLTGSATALVSGWNMINGDYYYFADNKLATGIQKIGKNKYIFDMNGKMLYGRTYNINEADPDLHYYCYLDKNGAMLTDGWSADHEHYANAEGALLTGVQMIDGKSYVFTEYGTLCHNEQIMSIDRKKIYITNARGEVSQTISASKSGWIQDNFKRWYYSQNGTFMKNRKCVIGGKTYYFLWNGEMATNCYVEGGYADKNGVVISNGWSDDHKMYFRNGDYVSGDQMIDGKYYYFNDYDNSNSEGIFRVNGKNYYYDGLGNKTVQTLKTGWNQINSNWCYLNADGTLASGITKVGSKYYYFGRENGFMKKDYGIYEEATGQMYFGSDGVLFTNGWKEINGLKYYFDQNGHSLTGKRHIDGKWYIFDSTGALIQ